MKKEPSRGRSIKRSDGWNLLTTAHFFWTRLEKLGNFVERAVILTSGRSLEVPLTELHHAEIDRPVDHLSVRGTEQIVRIVRETISEMNNGSSISAARESE